MLEMTEIVFKLLQCKVCFNNTANNVVQVNTSFEACQAACDKASQPHQSASHVHHPTLP